MPDKKILFLLYNFPPEFGTAPKRNYRMYKTIGKHFSQSFIITKKKSEIRPDAGIIELKTFDYRDLIKKFSSSGYVAESAKSSLFSRFLIKLINTFPFNILFGEGGGIYMLNSCKAASRLIKQHSITHIYSSYRPIADHFVANRLKKKFPSLVWIADFRDLPVEPHYKLQFFPRIHHFIYKKLFQRTDVMTTVSQGLADELDRYDRPVFSVMNGMDADYAFPLPVTTDYFSLVYTGSMYSDERNPWPVFAALNNLIGSGRVKRDKIRIEYAGKDSAFWRDMAQEAQLEDILNDHGLLDGALAGSLQQNACINLLLTMSSNQLSGILTGKYIEYLQAGNPILCIVKNQNDTFLAQELSRLNAGISVSDKEEEYPAIEQFILDKYLNWQATGKNEKTSDQSTILQFYDSNRLISVIEPYLK
ncbi:MAG: hypothetical protein J5I59_13365 [Saprospiraceae bacterium]|nr:hypothetical protein [Saprospiraceae bacterium]